MSHHFRSSQVIENVSKEEIAFSFFEVLYSGLNRTGIPFFYMEEDFYQE